MSSFKSQEFRKEFLKEQLNTSSNVLVQKIYKEIESYMNIIIKELK